MTRNAVDAIRNQEIARQNSFDRKMRPIEAAISGIGSLGSLIRGIGSFAGKGGERGTSTVNHYHYKGKE